MKAMGAGVFDRYLSLGWRHYLPNLLKRRME
jgi:hypothetical protein